MLYKEKLVFILCFAIEMLLYRIGRTLLLLNRLKDASSPHERHLESLQEGT